MSTPEQAGETTERERAVRLTERIIDVLFTSGDKEAADRLALKQRRSLDYMGNPDYFPLSAERELGGWNREAATRQVLAVLLSVSGVPATPPASDARVRALVDRLENHYDFQCEGGPLKNCVEWRKLVAAALGMKEA